MLKSCSIVVNGVSGNPQSRGGMMLRRESPVLRRHWIYTKIPNRTPGGSFENFHCNVTPRLTFKDI